MRVCYASTMLLKAWLQESGRRDLLSFLLSFSGRDSWEKQWWTLRSLWVWINECVEPGAQGRQMTCRLSLLLKAQLYQVKNTELRVLIKIVINPPRSHPLSPSPDTLQPGNLRPLTAFWPILGFVFPPAVFYLSFCSSSVAIYRFFLLAIALSRWVSVSSYPPTTPLISRAGFMVSLCSRKSWCAALWTGC